MTKRWIVLTLVFVLTFPASAQNDPNVIGVFAWIYQTFQGWTGAGDPSMAPELAAWQVFGAGVMNR